MRTTLTHKYTNIWESSSWTGPKDSERSVASPVAIQCGVVESRVPTGVLNVRARPTAQAATDNPGQDTALHIQSSNGTSSAAEVSCHRLVGVRLWLKNIPPLSIKNKHVCFLRLNSILLQDMPLATLHPWFWDTLTASSNQRPHWSHS